MTKIAPCGTITNNNTIETNKGALCAHGALEKGWIYTTLHYQYNNKSTTNKPNNNTGAHNNTAKPTTY